MTRTRSLSSSSSYIQQNPDSQGNNQNMQVINPTSEVYKQAYQSLMNNEFCYENTHQNIQVSLQHSIPPSHVMNLKPVNPTINSPLRRAHSPSENDLSDLDDFIHDPNTRLIQNTRKKTKTNNNNNSKNLNSNKSRVAAPVGQPRFDHHQSNFNEITFTNTHLTTTTLSNQEPNINPANINKLTDAVKAFAQSRYPFAPFILRFPTPHINEKKITDELCKFLKNNKQVELELIGFRKASTKCSMNECDLLLFVKNSRSFSILFDENNWPQSIHGLTYTRPSIPTIPSSELIFNSFGKVIDYSNNVSFTTNEKYE